MWISDEDGRLVNLSQALVLAMQNDGDTATLSAIFPEPVGSVELFQFNTSSVPDLDLLQAVVDEFKAKDLYIELDTLILRGIADEQARTGVDLKKPLSSD